MSVQSKPAATKRRSPDFTGRRLIREGDRALRRGELRTAQRLYQSAHDQLRHSPADHRLVHEKLVVVNRELGNWASWLAGNMLLISAPLGTFRLLARLRPASGSAQSAHRKHQE